MKIILIMILVLLVSCTTNTTINNDKSAISNNIQTLTDDEAIDLLLSQWEEAIRTGNRDLFLKLFSDDEWTGMGRFDK
ncbi:MAG: hypothetical protein PF693_12245 [Spirochaetia bacterium]|jgi:hypothetical protein|nr:hypothetical protein [Spirochaetia bacterium]